MNPRSNSFGLGPRSSSGPRRSRPARVGHCVALLDDRFIAWLSQRDCEPGSEPVLQRRGLGRLLGRLLFDAGIDASIKRIYWYTDRPDGLLCDEQIVRPISALSPDASDHDSPGLEAWGAIERDLQALSQAQAFDLILIASDDERLTRAINEAQLRGASVCLLADDSVSDYATLCIEEPEWAALLAQADRRLVVRPSDLTDLRGLPVRVGADDGLGDGPSTEQSLIEEVVRAWWADQSDDARDDLRAALQVSPGIPQDVDRALLLQTRERFVRPLSFNEKKIMRECLREVVAESADIDAEVGAL